MTAAAANSTTTGTLPANTTLRVLGESIVTITRDGAFVASQSTARDNFVGPYPVDSSYSVVAGDAAIDISLKDDSGAGEARVPLMFDLERGAMLGPDGTEYAVLPIVDPDTGESLTYSRAINDLTCLYRMQEESGSLLVDSLGNGPDLVLEGTLGTARTAAAGYITPNGTTHYVRVTDLNSVLAQLLDFRNTDDSAILIGFDLINAADILGTSCLLAIGGGATGTDGRFRLQLSTVESLQLGCRGVADTDTTFDTVSSVDTTGVSTRVSVLLVFHSPVGYTYQVDAYNNGVFAGTQSLNFSKSGLATSMPYAGPNGVTLFASEAATPGTFFNAGGSTAGVRHVFLRRSKHDAAQEARIASNLFFFPGARPATLSK